MPGKELYLNGFGLHVGLSISNWKLTSIDLKHDTIKRYHEYSYPIVMIWQPITSDASYQGLIDGLERQVSSERTINSEYGNPYTCKFGDLSHNYREAGSVVINAIGHCTRAY